MTLPDGFCEITHSIAEGGLKTTFTSDSGAACFLD